MVCHVWCNFKARCTCRTTIILGTLKNESLIDSLVPKNCFNHRNIFLNGTNVLSNALSKLVNHLFVKRLKILYYSNHVQLKHLWWAFSCQSLWQGVNWSYLLSKLWYKLQRRRSHDHDTIVSSWVNEVCVSYVHLILLWQLNAFLDIFKYKIILIIFQWLMTVVR